MKNLFLALVFMLVGSFVSANPKNASEVNNNEKRVENVQNLRDFNGTISSQTEDLSIQDIIQIENVTVEDYPCRWRVCTYRNGVLVGCTAWTYGECLDPVVIK